jgi:hypothetical protein
MIKDEKIKHFFATLAIPDEDIIGHRFGLLYVVGKKTDDAEDAEPQYLVRCNDESAPALISQSDLLMCKYLTAPFQKDSRTTRRYCVKEYGALTDFDYAKYGIEVCSYCGHPVVYAKGLCRNCTARSRTRVGLEYLSVDEPHNKLTRIPKDSPEYEVKAAMLMLSKSAPYADEMRNLYLEGYTYQQIADKYGVTRQRVYQILHKVYVNGGKVGRPPKKRDDVL